MPAHECNVVPPMFTEAMPVDAVMARVGHPFPPQVSMIERSRTDFPVPNKIQLRQDEKEPVFVPADPVKKMFSLLCTISRTALCSLDRMTVGVCT